MWAPLAVLLMVFASALGALETEPGLAATEDEDATAGVELALESASGSVLPLDEPLAAVLTPGSVQAAAAVTPIAASAMVAPEPLGISEELVEPMALPPLAPERRIPGFDLRAERDALPGVAGDPRLLRSVAARPLLPSGRLTFEAGVQVPIFDDRPGMPEPEFLFGFRFQF